MSNSEKPVIYLNNAATSWPKPASVAQIVAESLASPVYGSGRTSGTQGRDYVSEARDALSKFFNCGTSENIIFTSNATDSLNILISGFIHKHPKIHVLTTEQDHNSVLRPLYESERSGLINLGIVPIKDGRITPESVMDMITPKTKLMVMSQAGNVIGTAHDVKAIAEVLHENDIFFILDGAQSAGHIKTDLKDIGADAFVFTSHKGLFGIAGSGGFYIKNPEEADPLKYGGTGTESQLLYQPDTMPERYECGTHNYPGIASILAGVEFIEDIGIENIEKKADRQCEYIINRVKDIENVELYSKHPDVPIISFNIKGLSDDDVGFIFSRMYNIVVRTGLHCAPLIHKVIDGGKGCVRASMSWFTTDEECRIFADAVCEVAENAGSKINTA